MELSFQCSQCGTTLELGAEHAGAEVTCPVCETGLTVREQGPGPGAVIGGFRIDGLLHAGGMGKVFLAQQLSVDRQVVLKILPPRFCVDRENVERFLLEARTAGRLQHPHIVTTYDAGADDGVYYIAMEYVSGESLGAYLRREGRLTEAQALGITHKIADALTFAWESHRVLHRDVRPDNILLTEDGEPKLSDMGISKNENKPSGSTEAGFAAVTPNYMSPEQIEDPSGLDCRSDMYSLGATLYQMLTGIVPFEDETIVKQPQQTAMDPLQNPRELHPSISKPCVNLLRIMMAGDRDRRHDTWEACTADIERAIRGEPVASPVPGPRQSLVSIGAGPRLVKTPATTRGPARKAPKTVTHPAAKADVERPATKRGGSAQAVTGTHKAPLVVHVPHDRPHHAVAPRRRSVGSWVALGIVALVVVAAGLAARPLWKLYSDYERRENRRLLTRRLEQKLEDAKAYASNNAEAYEAVIDHLNDLKNAAGGMPIAARVEQELTRVRSAREAARTSAWVQLLQEAGTLFAAGSTDAAIDALRNYSGPFAEQLSGKREEEAARLAAKAADTHEADAQRERDRMAATRDELQRLVERAAGHLVALRTGAARSLIEDAVRRKSFAAIPEAWRVIREHTLAAAGFEEAILDSLRADVGRTITLSLRSGQRRVKVEGVDGNTVRVRELRGAAMVGVEIAVTDLSAAERLRRIGDGADDRTQLMRGMVALQARALPSAHRCFSAVDGPLSRELAARTLE